MWQIEDLYWTQKQQGSHNRTQFKMFTKNKAQVEGLNLQIGRWHSMAQKTCKWRVGMTQDKLKVSVRDWFTGLQVGVSAEKIDISPCLDGNWSGDRSLTLGRWVWLRWRSRLSRRHSSLREKTANSSTSTENTQNITQRQNSPKLLFS